MKTLSAFLMLILGILIGRFSHLRTLFFEQFSSEYDNQSSGFEDASSVWCYKRKDSHICTFKNMCYDPDSKHFIFILTNGSTIYGLHNKHELQHLDLSSILNHNLFTFKVAIVNKSNGILKKPTTLHKPIFLLTPFKQDNIMHVLHDDILPLYFTFFDICKGSVDTCVSKYKLVLLSNNLDSSHRQWYQIFSNSAPLYLYDIYKFTCFQEIQVGLLKISIWFQYGFSKPQGPLNNTILHGSMVRKFTDFVLKQMNVIQDSVDTNSIVSFNRKLNRRIINEEYLKTGLITFAKSVYPSSQPFITNIDLSSHNTTFILRTVLKSKIVIGMHSSAMIFCLFLKPGSLVVELFPFGIHAEHVSYIKAYSEIAGSGILYKSWENTEESNSIPHPEAPPLLGGIYHLSHLEQENIINAKDVPAVQCCHNPTYLYRMYQDTIVDNSLLLVFKQGLLQQTQFSMQSFYTQNFNDLQEQWFFPASVTNVSCTKENKHIKISWLPPVNLNTNHVSYLVTFTLQKEMTHNVQTSICSIIIDFPYVDGDVFIDIWVKVNILDTESLDSYTNCHVIL